MLTPPQQRYFQTYLASLMAALDMDAWQIDVSADPCSPENNAEIVVVAGQKRADVYLSRMYPYESVEVQRHFIVHELVHALIREMPDAIRLAKASMSRTEYRMLKKAHLQAEENVVDHLAGVIAARLPTPKPMWCKRARKV